MSETFKDDVESWEVERVTKNDIAIKHEILRGGKPFMISGVVTIPVESAKDIAEAIIRASEVTE